MKDFLLNEDNDLLIEYGDWLLADSDQQHIQLLLTSMPAEWKENPETGVGLTLSQHGLIDGFIKRTIAVQLEADGFKLDNLQITETGLIIDAKRI
ncbi:MAG: hypothetical protein E6Q66_05820 [Pedobacter sp.]|nr:MAG: hypothetical protein E6Q66_05820 [Pedobacter sp.]